MRDLISFDQGVKKIIVGPVKSGKTTQLVSFARSCMGRIFKDDNYLIVKHPKNGETKLGEFDALVTHDPDDIAARITENTEFVLIEDIHMFEDPKIVSLSDALIMSGRKELSTGIPLDGEGKPYNHMPAHMALSDLFEVRRAFCTKCGAPATRSKKVNDHYEPACKPHWNGSKEGYLETIVGPMYSSKSDTQVQRFIQEAIRAGALDLVRLIEESKDIDHPDEKIRKRLREEHGAKVARAWKEVEGSVGFVMLKSSDDNRYDERDTNLESIGIVNTHYKIQIPAIQCNTAEDQLRWLKAHPKVKEVYIEEPQFFERQAEVVEEMVYSGMRVFAAGLHRDFTRTPFGDVPIMLALSDKIQCRQAFCDHEITVSKYNRQSTHRCNRLGTENQRLKRINGVWVPADFHDPQIIPGGKEGEALPLRYEVWCRPDHLLPNAEHRCYEFPLLEKK